MLRKNVIGHLLFLLLDRDHSGAVPSEQALENLYGGLNLESPQDIKILNDAVCYNIVVRRALMSLSFRECAVVATLCSCFSVCLS